MMDVFHFAKLTERISTLERYLPPSIQADKLLPLFSLNSAFIFCLLQPVALQELCAPVPVLSLQQFNTRTISQGTHAVH